jgi:acyl-homoserine lactone acylase PvdQ
MNVYGAVTWGQFFVYQGFNQYGGWMHTSSQVDVSDMYQEQVEMREGIPYYLLDGNWRPMQIKKISLQVKGEIKPREISAYFTHRGAVMAQRDGKWISVRSYNRSLLSLEQSWLRTKTTGLKSYQKVMDMRANTSNNTVYADNKGNIAYWHGNFVPIRDPKKDWGLVQDGTRSANDWKGLHPVNELVHVVNPVTGWIQNCNSTPFTVSGSASPLRSNYPSYMAPDGENFRDKNAVRLFSSRASLDVNDLIKVGYDRHLAAFDVLIPSLINAHAKSPRPELKELVDSLAAWDRNAQVNSISQHMAIRWASLLLPSIPKIRTFGGETDPVINFTRFANEATSDVLLDALLKVKLNVEQQFGTWKIAWGEVNRFQRISNSVMFDDLKPSLPVAFTSSAWGQLPSYTSKPYMGSKKWYGVNGNSFVAAIEFGPKVKAYSLLAGGQSGDPNSEHFFDQAENYTQGKFKLVLFYKKDVLEHVVKKYRPFNN